MAKSKLARPDFIVAMLAVVIGVCTMFVYIYQANIMSKQMHSSVWPHLQTNVSESEKGIMISVHNKGIGPALVKSTYVIVDGKTFSDSKANMDSIAMLLTGKMNLLNGYTNVKDRVISANEEVRFIEITDTASVALFNKAMVGHTIRIKICYCSVYGDCWTVSGIKTTPCENCECE